MKKKDRMAFHSTSLDDLKKQLVEIEKKNTHIRLSQSTTRSKNTRELRRARHTIAVIQTIMRESELAYGKK